MSVAAALWAPDLKAFNQLPSMRVAPLDVEHDLVLRRRGDSPSVPAPPLVPPRALGLLPVVAVSFLRTSPHRQVMPTGGDAAPRLAGISRMDYQRACDRQMQMTIQARGQTYAQTLSHTRTHKYAQTRARRGSADGCRRVQKKQSTCLDGYDHGTFCDDLELGRCPDLEPAQEPCGLAEDHVETELLHGLVLAHLALLLPFALEEHPLSSPVLHLGRHRVQARPQLR